MGTGETFGTNGILTVLVANPNCYQLSVSGCTGWMARSSQNMADGYGVPQGSQQKGSWSGSSLQLTATEDSSAWRSSSTVTRTPSCGQASDVIPTWSGSCASITTWRDTCSSFYSLRKLIRVSSIILKLLNVIAFLHRFFKQLLINLFLDSPAVFFGLVYTNFRLLNIFKVFKVFPKTKTQISCFLMKMK